jgi:hypothetical protein
MPSDVASEVSGAGDGAGAVVPAEAVNAPSEPPQPDKPNRAFAIASDIAVRPNARFISSAPILLA